MRWKKNLLPLLLICFGTAYLSAQESTLVYPTFDRYETFNDAYIAPEGRGYAVGNCGTLYRTTDDGASWTLLEPVAENREPRFVQCKPGTNCLEAFVGTNGGTYLTTDAGVSWMRVSFASLKNLDFSLPGIIYGSIPAGREIYRSEDGGLTWANLSLPVQIRGAPQLRGLNDFGMISGEHFYRSTDRGETWQQGFHFGKRTALIHLDEEGNYYVETFGSDIYKSTDGGESWNLQTEDAHQYGVYYDLFKDAEDSLHVISFNGIRFSSGDDGVTWAPSRTIRFQRYQSIRRGEGRGFATGNGLTVMITAEDFTQVRSLFGDEYVAIREIVFENSDRAYAFGQDGEIMRSDNGGGSWNVVSTIGSWQESRPKVAPNGHLFGVQRFTNFSRSTNQGEDWQELTSATEALGGGRKVFDVLPNGEIVVMTNQRTVRLDTDTRVIFQADGGHPSTSGGTFDLKMVTADLGFIIRWARLDIYRTTDGGVTWDTIPAFGGNNFFNWFDVEDETTFAIGNGSSAWRTTDAGLSWTEMNSRYALGRFSIGEDTYAFSRTTLHRSRDGGINWEEKFETCTSPIDMVRRPGTNEVFLAYLNGIERLDLDEILSSTRRPAVTSKPLKAWPNPTGGSVVIALPETDLVGGSATIFDLAGRQMSAPVQREGNRLRVNLGRQKAGVYVLRYVNDEGVTHQVRVVRQ